MLIDAIVTDLDDTLLNGSGELGQYTIDILRECTKRGIRVIPASGRAQASMEPFVRELQTGQPYIACNGSQLVNADHTVADTICLDPELAREVCRFLFDNRFYVQAYKDDYFFYSTECEYSHDYKRSSGMKGIEVGDLISHITFPVPKLLSVSSPANVAKLYPEACSRFKDRLIFTVSKPYFLETEPIGASKGLALERLSARIGLVPEKTLVFGDSLNDITMLEFTPNSVAVSNARPEVIGAAKYRCGANTDEGVAHFIYDNVLSVCAEGE